MKFGVLALKIPLIVLWTLLICSCGNKSSQSSAHFSIPIPLTQIHPQGCLNLQELENHFLQPGFHAQSRRVTYDVVTSARSAQFQVYNFGITESQITRLPLIQGVTQTDCSSLTLTTSYGRVLNYKITDYGPHSLHIERDLTQDQNEPIKAIAEAQKFEPEIKSLKVTVESAHTIFFQIAAKTLFAHCGAERLKEYSKDFRLHLRDPATSFSDTEKVNSYYLQQIKQLIPTSVEGASELSPLADQVSVSEILNLQNLLRSKEISSSCASSI